MLRVAKRIAFNFATILSLLFCAALTVFWARSLMSAEAIGATSIDDRYFIISSDSNLIISHLQFHFDNAEARQDWLTRLNARPQNDDAMHFIAARDISGF